MFEAGLLERLATKYPAVEVRAIADRISKRSDVRNPSALLIHKVRSAARQISASVEAETGQGLEEAKEPLRGGFWPDGSFNPGGDWTDEVSRAVRRVIDRDLSPAEAVGALEACGLAGVLGPAVTNWSTLNALEDWPYAWCATSAAEAIKRRGLGGQGRWSEAHRWTGGRETEIADPWWQR